MLESDIQGFLREVWLGTYGPMCHFTVHGGVLYETYPTVAGDRYGWPVRRLRA